MTRDSRPRVIREPSTYAAVTCARKRIQETAPVRAPFAGLSICEPCDKGEESTRSFAGLFARPLSSHGARMCRAHTNSRVRSELMCLSPKPYLHLVGYPQLRHLTYRAVAR